MEPMEEDPAADAKAFIDADYERENLRTWAEATRAGTYDATHGQPYKPTRVKHHEHRNALDASAYHGGWVNAICERSRWRRLVYMACWKLEYLVTRVGPGRKGLSD